ncbi:MAG: RES family NAD+ phosphorylase [Acidovorax sp.]
MDWDRAWLAPPFPARALRAWRGVEAQHVVSTMRLVDTTAEQDLLEQLLEGSKPALPAAARPRHYLLATPFRYRPPHASRFRPPHAPGQWYGAESVFAACAEVAYWRHRFILESAGLLEQALLTEHTFFQAVVDGRAIDLLAPPWSTARALWTHGSDYTATHAVAAAAQEQGVQWLAYESVRAPGLRCAVAFDPDCLGEPPGGLDKTMQTWHCKATRSGVMFTRGPERYQWTF